MSLPTPNLEQVKQAIFAGKKIEAIKLHREATGLGLKESKEAVEKLETELRRTETHRFETGVKQGGCFSVMVAAATLGLAVGAAWLNL